VSQLSRPTVGRGIRTRTEVRRALRRHRARLLAIRGVVGLGIGRKVRQNRRFGSLAIRVYVRVKRGHARLNRTEVIPRRVRGVTPSGRNAGYFVPTDVVKGSGSLAGLALRGGQGVVGQTSQGGTLGLCYRSVGGRAFVLTNAHVAVALNFKPGQLDSSACLTQSARDVAVISRFTTIQTGGGANTMDAALGWVYGDESIDYLALRGEALRISGVESFDRSGDTVYHYVNRHGVAKYFWHPDEGESEVVTFGTGSSARFARFILLSGVPGRQHTVESGDSGSLLVRRNGSTLKAVALVFAGTGNRVAVYPIKTALSRLGVAEASRYGKPEDVGIDFD